MRLCAALLLTAAALAGAPAAMALGALPSAFITVAAALALAWIVSAPLSQPPTPATLVSGAVGALGHALLWPLSPVAAGAAFFGALFLNRALRARGGKLAQGGLLALAAGGGASATWIVAWHQTSPLAVWIVAVAVGAVVASAAWLVATDDQLTATLDALAQRNKGTARWRLERAAALRRRRAAQLRDLPRGEARRIEQAFRALVKVGQARAEADDSSAEVLDETLGEHLAALEQSFRAAGIRAAVVASTAGKQAASDLRQENMTIEAEAEALAEVGETGA